MSHAHKCNCVKQVTKFGLATHKNATLNGLWSHERTILSGTHLVLWCPLVAYEVGLTFELVLLPVGPDPHSMCWCLLAFFSRFALKVVWENLIIISFRFNLRDPKWCIILLHLEFQLTENKSPFWLLFPIFADKFTFSFVLVYILSQFPIIAPERNKTIKTLSGPFFADIQRTKDTICVLFQRKQPYFKRFGLWKLLSWQLYFPPRFAFKNLSLSLSSVSNVCRILRKRKNQ